MRSHLLNATTAERYRACLTEGVERVAAEVAAASRPFTGDQADDPSPRVAAVDLDAPLRDTVAALDELDALYLRDAVSFHHPHHLAGHDGPVVIPAVLGEAVLSAVNSSPDSRDRPAGAALIEQRLVDWTAERAGLGPAADGVFTSGSDQAGLQALLLAREEAGADDPRALRVFTSAAARPGVGRAAHLLGLGPDAVVAVPTDRVGRLQTVALVRELERCAREGLAPMAVVATAGTADFGSVDPLPQLAEVCAHHGTWLHVDAAHGGGPLLSRTRRHLLDGIERADSVTVDFHASFFQPADCSALLVRDAATLRHAADLTDHLDPRRAAWERAPGRAGTPLRGTRRFDALKLWLTLRVMGADAVGDLFDEICGAAARGFDLIAADPRFDVVAEPDLTTLVFRYIPAAICSPADIDRANLYARKALYASGAAVVAGTRAGERQYLKLALRDPETTAANLTAVLDLIAGHAEQYLGESLDRAS
ncbi:pyridoxal phosphate-dependent decarboxylase family protein [Streptomyces sp. AN091965]|uniref:pyridoxal phosphate-dependent decarboxylase family protein n=1 Tax=Streptomyces sp. AN091965 TaxID=2927803 RepID=UPI001F616E44|nr:pyridoxal-dependent decarboxylase [Streptomyces sp. AN091965]MCI3930830.1 pyridoxal-dependent decarboxylase [Streptomyces sp. AN091965]